MGQPSFPARPLSAVGRVPNRRRSGACVRGCDGDFHLWRFGLLGKSASSPPVRSFTCAMSTPSAVARTAPIPIAPKPPRFPPSRQGSVNLDAFSGTSGYNSLDSDSPLTGNLQIPCDACQRRRIKCVMSDDDDSCISCAVNGAECSLSEGPQARKRKLNGDVDESRSKRR